jgi:TM2 domain-containing membrane protein YozV
MKESELERRFLDFVFTTDAPITVGAIAYHTGCTLEEAEAYLDKQARAGRIQVESTDDGHVFYVYPDRGKPSPANAAAGEATRPCPFCGEPIRTIAKKCRHCGEYLDPGARGRRALVPAVERRPAVREVVHPAAAAVLSLVWPGAGQMYCGRVGAGLGWMLATVLGYAMLIVPGIILNVLCIASAANTARAINERGGPA